MIDYRFIWGGFRRYGVPAVAGAIIVWILAQSIWSTRSGQIQRREFTPFYIVGLILNNHAPEKIYDPPFQNRIGHEILPNVTQDLNSPYSHAPFESLIYRPLAKLSHERAYAVWALVSFLLFCAGFWLVWTSLPSAPHSRWVTPFLLTLSFYPILAWCITMGQVAAIGFFWMALAIHLEQRKNSFSSGMAIAPCLCKPTLLVLLLPMMVISRRGRTLLGFSLGCMILLCLSLLAVGWRGCIAYAYMLLRFGRGATANHEIFKTGYYVDLVAFFRVITGGHGYFALAFAATAGAVVLPFLVRVWWRAQVDGDARRAAWFATLVWTVIVNVYSPIYDGVLVALGCIVGGDVLYGRHRRLPVAYQWLIALAYSAGWIWPESLRWAEGQVYTVTFVALGSYALWAAAKTADRPDSTRSAPPVPITVPISNPDSNVALRADGVTKSVSSEKRRAIETR